MNKTLRWTAWAGLLGSLLMFVGDMLLYFTTEEIVDIERELLASMGSVPPARFFAGGIVAPFATFMYIPGFYHIYLRVKNTHKIWGRWIFGILSLGIISGGAFHACFPAFGIVAAQGHPELINSLTEYTSLLGDLAFGCFGLGWLLYTYIVLRKQADFPRWTVFFTPLVTVWLVFLWHTLPAPFEVILAGGWFSLMFTVFYIVALTTAKRSEKNTPLEIA